MNRNRSRRALPTLLFMLTASLAGCREGWQADTYPAAGRMTVNGKPAAGALVQLMPQGAAPDVRNSRPWGMVGADGTFQLSTYEPGSGAPPGEYAVTLTWPVDASVLGSPDRLGGKFAEGAQPPIKVTLKAEPNQIPPIELTRVKVIENPRATGAGRMPPP